MPSGRELVEQRDGIYPLASLVPQTQLEAARDAVSARRQTWIDVLADGKTFDCDDASRHVKACEKVLEALGAEPKAAKTRKRSVKPADPEPRQRLEAERAALELAHRLTPQGWRDENGLLPPFERQRASALRSYLDDGSYDALAEYQELTWWVNHLAKVEHVGELAAAKLRVAPMQRVA